MPAKDPGGKALLERAPLIFNKGEMREFPAETTDHLLAEGLQSLCYVPLLRPKGPLGVLVLGSTRVDAFKTDDLTLLNQVAAQLAIAMENARTTHEVEQLRSRLEREKRFLQGESRTQLHFEEIIGESLALKAVLDQVTIVAASDATVLILGETGTGKGLIARAIHRSSKRKERSFVTLNCAAIPTGLLESELFGHEKGAFTGAVSQKIGRLELADKGTLFLDEIGEIPLELQPKLLRVLQDHEFERLGGTRTIKVDLRLIAATNRDLARSVVEKEFRSDLFYRLNVFPIRLPSLRERREDIPLLVKYFVRKFARAMDRGIETVPSETHEYPSQLALAGQRKGAGKLYRAIGHSHGGNGVASTTGGTPGRVTCLRFSGTFAGGRGTRAHYSRAAGDWGNDLRTHGSGPSAWPEAHHPAVEDAAAGNYAPRLFRPETGLACHVDIEGAKHLYFSFTKSKTKIAHTPTVTGNCTRASFCVVLPLGSK